MKILKSKKEVKLFLREIYKKISSLKNNIKSYLNDDDHHDDDEHTHTHARTHAHTDDFSDDHTEEIEFNNLRHLKDFFYEYVGYTIINFTEYKENSPTKGKAINNKIITDVSYDREHIILKLSTLNGRRAGKVIVSVGDNGMFVEKNTDEEESNFTKYRFEFMDGSVIEYVDRLNKNFLEFKND